MVATVVVAGIESNREEKKKKKKKGKEEGDESELVALKQASVGLRG